MGGCFILLATHISATLRGRVPCMDGMVHEHITGIHSMKIQDIDEFRRKMLASDCE